MRYPRWAIWACVAGTLFAAHASRGWAQPAESRPAPQPQPAPATTRSSGPPKLEDLPPQVRLAVRVESLRLQLPVIPDLVIVPDGASYLLAISTWRRDRRFPVLIDDGGVQSAEDIARFARAFKPRSIVRWDRSAIPGENAMPESDLMRQQIIELAALKAWGGEGEIDADLSEALIGQLKTYNVQPPGVVFADVRDPSWTAALALAAGRGQPIIWYERPGHWTSMGITPSASINLEVADGFEKSIEDGCALLGVPWDGLGDVIDAITICGSMPVKVQVDGGTALATTDYLGRKQPRENSAPRWAWCGQIWGEGRDDPAREARAAYIAMSSLFTQPGKTWLFDGYEIGQPWAAYDMTEGGKILRERGFDHMMDDFPNGSAERWRRRASTPLDAGLVLVNSRGNPEFFALEPGIGRPGDTPFLSVPTMISIVHSFSAQRPSDRDTIAGRWLERGAFVYFGSVDEPYLQAFIPTSVAVQRLLAPMPVAAALRADTGPAWKLMVFGDPLFTLGRAAPRIDEPMPLPKTSSLEASVDDAMKTEKPEEAIRAMVMLGRDHEASELVYTIVRERKEQFTPGVAANAMGAVFRSKPPGGEQASPEVRGALLAALFNKMTPELRRDSAALDLLWLGVSPLLAAKPDERLIRILRDAIRPDNAAVDSIALARAMLRVQGRAAAIAVLKDALGRARHEHDTRELNEVLQEFGSGR